MTARRRAPRRGGGPRPLRESLDHLADDLGAGDASGLCSVFTRWREIVGDTVADHAWPVALADGVLVVGVDHPAWRTQLAFLEADVRRQVADVTGLETTRVDVRVRAR